jgi:hypothetical protein
MINTVVKNRTLRVVQQCRIYKTATLPYHDLVAVYTGSIFLLLLLSVDGQTNAPPNCDSDGAADVISFHLVISGYLE